MNGIDQIIVALWFLPVVLFVIIPLSVTCLWLLISPIVALLRPVAGQANKGQRIKAKATA